MRPGSAWLTRHGADRSPGMKIFQHRPPPGHDAGSQTRTLAAHRTTGSPPGIAAGQKGRWYRDFPTGHLQSG